MNSGCTVYFKSSSAFVVPQSRTVEGVWVAHGPANEIVHPEDADSVQAAIQEALSHSRENLPPDRDFNNPQRELMKSLGERSWGTLFRNSRLVGANVLNDRCHVQGYRKGPRANNIGVPEMHLECKFDELGATVLRVYQMELALEDVA